MNVKVAKVELGWEGRKGCTYGCKMKEKIGRDGYGLIKRKKTGEKKRGNIVLIRM